MQSSLFNSLQKRPRSGPDQTVASLVLIGILEVPSHNLWPCVMQSRIFQKFRGLLRNVKKRDSRVVQSGGTVYAKDGQEAVLRLAGLDCGTVDWTGPD